MVEGGYMRATDAIGCLQRQIWSAGDDGYSAANTTTSNWQVALSAPHQLLHCTQSYFLQLN